MTPALVDTNILIDYLSGVQNAFDELSFYTDRAISIMTWMEVMVGAKPDREMERRAVLNMFQVLPITNEVAEKAVLERRNSRIKLPDAIILATAQQHGRLLITRNTKDFSPENPLVRIPYRL